MTIVAPRASRSALTMSDHFTIFRAKGLPATKTIGAGPDGRPAIVSSYGNATRFTARQVPVTGPGDVAWELDTVRPDEFVIRGELLPGVDPRELVPRLHSDPVTGEARTFGEKPYQ